MYFAGERWTWAFFLLAMVASSFAEVEINEVMYAPTANFGGQYNEWVELRNLDEDSFDYSNCSIDGKSLGGGSFNDYLVLANKLDLFEDIYPGIKAIDVSISLKNDADKIDFVCDEFRDSFSYGKQMGGSRNNRTLEKRSEGTWGETLVNGGTPGRQNSIFDFSGNYLPLTIAEIYPDPYGKDDASKPQGEWVELLNEGDKPLYLGGLELRDQDDDNELLIADSNVLSEYGLIHYPGDYVVIYRDRDSDFALNNNGYEEVRLFNKDELIHQVSYTGSVEAMSWSNIEGDFYLTAPTPGEINDIREDCDWLLILDMNNSIYKTDDLSFTITAYRYIGLWQNVSVKGQIEDINGEIVKEYSPWTDVKVVTEKTKSYNPNLPEGIYQISFWFDRLECDDQELFDNEVSTLIAINPEYKNFDSSIEIGELSLSKNNQAEWGEQFTAKVDIYKGDETRQVVQLWAEKNGKVISKKTKLNLVDTYKHYPLTLPVQLLPNCDNDITDGDGELILDAFGLRTEKHFEIKGVDNEICTDYLDYIDDVKVSEKASFQIVDLPASIDSGNAFKVRVQVINDDKEREYKVWSYMFRGSKCYSCGTSEREANEKKFSLSPYEAKVLEFLLKADEMKEGEYKVKVKLKKDGQKTEKEVTEAMFVHSAEEKVRESENDVTVLAATSNSGDSEETGFGKLTPQQREMKNKATGFVVYESSSEKAKKLIPVVLAVSFGLLCLVLVWKKS